MDDNIKNLIDRGALFVINHSGGKDSQAMTILLQQLIPADQLVIVHAHLPEVEWENTLEHIQRYSFNIPVRVTEAVKTFFQMVDHRKMFPSSQQRQCTSDLKRGPIEREIRKVLGERNQKLIVNCMGMRAQESPKRSRLAVFKKNNRNSVAGREWYDWLPIHDWSTQQVFSSIQKAGQKPFWVYEAGISRKSCCFCIMGSTNDLTLAARLRPALYKRYVSKEKELNHTLSMNGVGLEKITGIPA